VLIVNAVASMDEAVDRTNASTMGLGASIFGRRDVTRIAAGLRVGMISVNSVMPIVAMPTLPFGGVGDSGFGRIHGEEGLKEFARTKAIARQRFAPALRVLSFDRPAWTIDALVRLAKLLYGR
jgi:succinate-semialdehyde dehydrogenase / glutarate-semialdehyde dehydrogenase